MQEGRKAPYIWLDASFSGTAYAEGYSLLTKADLNAMVKKVSLCSVEIFQVFSHTHKFTDVTGFLDKLY